MLLISDPGWPCPPEPYSWFTVSRIPISSSSSEARSPPCAMCGKPLRPEERAKNVLTAGMGGRNEPLSALLLGGDEREVVLHSVRQFVMVLSVRNVSAKKESSVDVLGSRERVGYKLHSASRMCFAHHGMSLKNALLAFSSEGREDMLAGVYVKASLIHWRE
jgi:hypothetical protein